MPRSARARDNGWIKFYAGGAKLPGLDRDIPSGRCSWSKTQLEAMVGCRVNHDGASIEILGPGEYWQSDTLTVLFQMNSTVKPLWDSRRLQKKILPTDRFLTVRSVTKHHSLLEITPSNPVKNLDNVREVLVFKPEDVGQWLTLELSIDSISSRWYMSQERI